MTKTDFKSVDHYIAMHPEAVRSALELVRRTIRGAVPSAEDVISYQIPAYRLSGGTVIHFAGWKRHYSLYPVTAQLADAFKDEVAAYELNDRGTLRFPLDQPVPVKLIAEPRRSSRGPCQRSLRKLTLSMNMRCPARQLVHARAAYQSTVSCATTEVLCVAIGQRSSIDLASLASRRWLPRQHKRRHRRSCRE